MWIKLLVAAFFMVILYCLGSGLFYLFRQGKDSTQMAKALTWRIALSISLFGLLLLFYFLGWIVPNTTIVTS